MKKGLFYSPEHDFKVLNHLLSELDLSIVPSLATLRRKLTSEIDFVYLQADAIDVVLDVLAVVLKQHPEIAVIGSVPNTVKSWPAISGVYWLNPKHGVGEILNALAFHRAKKRDELWHHFPVRTPDRFFLSENANMGIVLTDADDHIFYANSLARDLLSLSEGRNLMDQYCNLREHVVLRFEEEDAGGRSALTTYDAVTVKTNGLVLSVSRRDVINQQQRVGAVYFLEDSEIKRANVKRLTDERRRFERLASRLNEVLLKDMSSHAYQLSYLQRKLDLEIRRAQRSTSQVTVLSLRLKGLDSAKLSAERLKNLLHELNELLLEEYPDPHVCCVVGDGHWVIVWQKDTGEMTQAGTWILSPVRQCIQAVCGDVKIEPQLTEETNLNQFRNGEDLLNVLRHPK